MNKQAVIDLLAAGRVANLPSVVSNVVTGVFLLCFMLWRDRLPVSWELVPWACLTGCLLYLGGCFLNDWWDRDWDRENKPDRAVPSGRLSSKLLLGFALAGLLGGLAVSLLLGWVSFFVALAIVGLIVLYSVIHKKTSWGVVPMGLCRSCLYLLGVSIGFSDGLGLMISQAVERGDSFLSLFFPFGLSWILPAAGLLMYIAGLSLLARFEAKGNLPRSNRVLALTLLAVPALTHSVFPVQEASIFSLLATIPFLMVLYWAARVIRKSLPKGVSLLLAGIPLLDFVLVGPLALHFLFARQSHDLFYWHQLDLTNIEMVGFLPLVTFVLALILQRIAPAT